MSSIYHNFKKSRDDNHSHMLFFEIIMATCHFGKKLYIKINNNNNNNNNNNILLDLVLEVHCKT